MEHRPDAVAVILKLLIGLVLGLASGSGPNPDQAFSAPPAEIVPVVIERQDKPFLEGQCLGHFAVLHFMGWVVVADPLLRIFVQHDADVVAAIRQDDTRLPIGDDPAADFGGHLIVLPDVLAVVGHGFLQLGDAFRFRMRM